MMQAGVKSYLSSYPSFMIGDGHPTCTSLAVALNYFLGFHFPINDNNVQYLVRVRVLPSASFGALPSPRFGTHGGP